MSVPLSIVVATHDAWPHVEPCLSALADQARAVGAEIIVADGSGDALPEDPTSLGANVVHVTAPGAGSFQLRALAVARAQGAIVAITEDHCVVRPDWCAEILRAHAQHPEAAAIGGAIENGSTCHLADWAGFFIANGPFMLPLKNGATDRISLQANISYKRRVLEGLPAVGPGFMEMLFNQELRRRHETLVADAAVVVEHVQCLSVPTFCALHFHNGRCIAGFRLQHMSAMERLVRLGGCAILPPVMLARTLTTVFRKGRLRGRAVASAPLMSLLLICHASGELLGYIGGPGASARYRHIG